MRTSWFTFIASLYAFDRLNPNLFFFGKLYILIHRFIWAHKKFLGRENQVRNERIEFKKTMTFPSEILEKKVEVTHSIFETIL